MSPSGKPQFDPLFPPGLHIISVDELRAMCIDPFSLSTSRKPIFQNLVDVLRQFADSDIVGDLWIDGSFVTTKFNPGDVDLVLCVSADLYDNCSVKQRSILEWFESESLHVDYRCDGYILVEWPREHPNYEVGLVAREYWTDFFGHTRDGYKKGIAVVRIKSALL